MGSISIRIVGTIALCVAVRGSCLMSRHVERYWGISDGAVVDARWIGMLLTGRRATIAHMILESVDESELSRAIQPEL